MEIEKLNTVAEYLDALDQIDHLWESEPDTPEGKELDRLVTLVEAYEEEHYPMDELQP